MFPRISKFPLDEVKGNIEIRVPDRKRTPDGFDSCRGFKVTVDLQGCLPENHSYARCLYYNHSKVYIIVKLIKCRIRRNNFFLTFDLMVSARKPSNAKVTLFVKLNYLHSCSQVRPNKLPNVNLFRFSDCLPRKSILKLAN